ncbi:MAG: hypothetical protein H0V66_13800 [Bdellovibrionales bacterium]|nr:hypothetical protein [Bdellovibrionales bacterium]
MDRAEVLAKQSLVKSPYYNYEALLVLIKVAESRHQFQVAINLAQKVLKDKPFHEGVLLTLVSSSLGFGKLKMALNYANQLVNLSPGMEPYAMRALVLLAQGKDDLALNDFANALKAETSDEPRQSAWVRSLIGRNYLKHGQIKNAELYLKSALKILPEFHMALALMADLEVERGNYETANLFFLKAFKAKQEPPYLMRHAKLKEHLGDNESANKLRYEAEKLIREEMAAGPYGHHNELAQLLLDRADPKLLPEAIAEAKRDADTRGTSESYYLLSQAFYRARLLEDAKQSINQAIASGITSCDYRKLASKIDGEMGGLKFKGHFSRECLNVSVSTLLASVGIL